MEWQHIACLPMFLVYKIWGRDKSAWPSKFDDPRVNDLLRANDEFRKSLKRA